MSDSPRLEKATLAGGCFWCTEAVFAQLRGVESVVSGYTDGETPGPTYEQVCTGTTGHAEAVEIAFNPETISYAELLEVFFRTHDPTTLNRQGNDAGTQYRSAVFYHDDRQKESAQRFIAELNGSGEFPSPVVTQLAPASRFYPAEEYHRDYFERNPNQGYCSVVIRPKLEKLTKAFAEKLKGES